MSKYVFRCWIRWLPRRVHAYLHPSGICAVLSRDMERLHTQAQEMLEAKW